MENMKHTRFDFKNEAERAVLKIYDYVGSWENVNTETIESQLLEANGKPLDIYINSYGGEVFEGFAIYNMLKRYEGFKTVYVDGIAASIASVIALSGNKIIMNKLSMFMIHNASSWAYGNADEIQKTVDALKSISALIRDLYVEKTSLTAEQVQEYMDAEKFFTAKECLECGFCDEISETEPEEDNMNLPANLLAQNIEKRINVLNSLKKAGFLNVQSEPEQKKEPAFFNKNNALVGWLKGD